MSKIYNHYNIYNFILTNHGHKIPKDILYNDKICNYLGQFKRIENIIDHIDNSENIQKNNNNKIINIYTGFILPIYVNPNHYILTKYIDKRISLNEKIFKLNLENNIKWTQANSLGTNHVIAIPINDLHYNQVPECTSPRNTFEIPTSSTRLWFLLGYFLRYGIIEHNKVYKNCILLTISGKKEQELLKYLNIFIISIHAILSNGLNDFSTYRIELKYNIFNTLDFTKDKKTIPLWIHNSSRFYLNSFIHGFIFNNEGIVSTFNSESYMYNWKISTDTIIVRNINIEMLLSFQLILFKCNIINTIIEDVNHNLYNINYRFFKMLITKRQENNLYPFFTSKYVWMPVTHIDIINNLVNDAIILNDSDRTYILNNIAVKNI